MINLVWITPNADQLVGDIARVSSVGNEGKDPANLIKYMIEHKHWSPFEMVSACFEIKTNRAIAHQILRHRSFSFQEFSQRYSSPGKAGLTLARTQATENRQSSNPTEDNDLIDWWDHVQKMVSNNAFEWYEEALKQGIGKELARMLLPEGLTETRLYMSGTLRSWIHYLDLRTAKDTQLEHRILAQRIEGILKTKVPIIMRAREIEQVD